MNYSLVIQTLQNRLAQKGINYSLDRLSATLHQLKNPHLDLKNIIHVAGTNGKGSTVTFIATALQHMGYTTGTFTSPHIKDYTERIAFNLQPIPKKTFSNLFQTLQQKISLTHLTEFEILTLLSIFYFKKTNPNFIIYEVGLGGRLDATNIFTPILCIITKIAKDHQDLLGKTLPKIALEKGGIIKPRIPLLTIKQYPAVESTLKKLSQQNNSPFTVIPPLKRLPNDLNLNATYQKENLALARAAIDHLMKNNWIKPQKNHFLYYNSAFIWGRFTEITYKTHHLIIDAAHNPSGIRALKKTIKAKYPTASICFIIGILKRKDALSMIKPLMEISQQIYICQFDKSTSYSYADLKPHLPHAAMVKPIDYHPHLLDRFDYQTDITVLTGSIYFISNFQKMK